MRMRGKCIESITLKKGIFEKKKESLEDQPSFVTHTLRVGNKGQGKGHWLRMRKIKALFKKMILVKQQDTTKSTVTVYLVF